LFFLIFKNRGEFGFENRVPESVRGPWGKFYGEAAPKGAATFSDKGGEQPY